MYNIKSHFGYAPSLDTPYIDLLYDTAMLYKDLATAKKLQKERDSQIQAQNAAIMARNRRNVGRPPKMRIQPKRRR